MSLKFIQVSGRAFSLEEARLQTEQGKWRSIPWRSKRLCLQGLRSQEEQRLLQLSEIQWYNVAWWMDVNFCVFVACSGIRLG